MTEDVTSDHQQPVLQQPLPKQILQPQKPQQNCQLQTNSLSDDGQEFLVEAFVENHEQAFFGQEFLQTSPLRNET